MNIWSENKPWCFEAYPDIGVTDSALRSTNILADLLNGMSSRLFNEVRKNVV